MNLKQLNHIVALSEALSFSKAAERVHLCQSALSKSISLIEEKIGIQIFDRTTNSVSITPTGQFVVDHAKNLLSEARSFSKNIEYLKTGALGAVSVGAGPYPAKCYLDTGIREFHKRYPKVSLRVRIDYWKNLLVSLREGQIDFFMADIRDLDEDAMLKITPLGGLTLALFCDPNHPLVAKDHNRRIKPQEILNYTFASVSLPNPVFHELKHSIGLDHNDTFAVNIECEDIVLISKIIPGSDIIFVSSNRMMEDSLLAGEVVKLNIPMTRNRFGEWALVQIKNRSMTPSAALLANLLIDLVREGSELDEIKYGFKGNKPLNFAPKQR
jgi:DNA-binding transcriptional LysR family regulator